MKAVALPAGAIEECRAYGREFLPFAEFPGWVTNGHFAVHVGGVMPEPLSTRRAPDSGLAALLAMRRTPVDEDTSFRIPWTAGEEDARATCVNCDGSGSCTCTCCDDDHDCRKCDGDGKVGPMPRRGTGGQRVYRGGELSVLLDGRIAETLDGLTTVALGDAETLPPIAGVDEQGDIVAIVMPMAGDPEEPPAVRP